MNTNVPLKLDRILYGGDYNPEQWPEAVWDDDIRLMKQASVNIATLPVFGWSALQPAEDKFTFEWLDRSIDKLHAAGVGLCLATPTAATPPWMAKKYPNILRADENGVRLRHGNRQTFCPNSQDYRRFATGIAGKLAERYCKHPALKLWHVSNEYSHHCWCDTCAAEFREWLKRRYKTLAELNDRWYTSFWGHRFGDWAEIDPPTEGGNRCLQAQRIDYDRFQSQSFLDCFITEKTVLRKFTPNVPVTTNLMAAFKPLDYHAWGEHLDIVSWDSYPPRAATPAQIAFGHALMRGVKEGAPWLLLEQTPSQQNWQAYNTLKRPGVLALWSYQAIAHGSDAVMYFQWRQSRGGIEKFHGGLVSHDGTDQSRVYKEVAALGKELNSLGTQTLNGRVEAHAAVLFDWDNWWAVEYSAGPTVDLKYQPQIASYYDALHRLGITADVISPSADLSRYKLVVAPLLYMTKPGVAERLEAFARGGGTVVFSFMSGVVDENDRCHLGGFPGPLRKLAGIWAEEIDVLPPPQVNHVLFNETFAGLGGNCACHLVCERIHCETAKAIATYGEDFYAGEPAITVNAFGKGRAFYVGTAPDPAGMDKLLRAICNDLKIAPPIPEPTSEIEATIRVSESGQRLLYLLYHRGEKASVRLPAGAYLDLLSRENISDRAELHPYGVRILTKA